jgi:hypothetical protein
LDTYPVPSYITQEPTLPHEAPVRYLDAGAKIDITVSVHSTLHNEDSIVYFVTEYPLKALCPAQPPPVHVRRLSLFSLPSYVFSRRHAICVISSAVVDGPSTCSGETRAIELRVPFSGRGPLVYGHHAVCYRCCNQVVGREAARKLEVGDGGQPEECEVGGWQVEERGCWRRRDVHLIELQQPRAEILAEYENSNVEMLYSSCTACYVLYRSLAGPASLSLVVSVHPALSFAHDLHDLLYAHIMVSIHDLITCCNLTDSFTIERQRWYASSLLIYRSTRSTLLYLYFCLLSHYMCTIDSPLFDNVVARRVQGSICSLRQEGYRSCAARDPWRSPSCTRPEPNTG